MTSDPPEPSHDPYQAPRGIEPQGKASGVAARDQRSAWSGVFTIFSLLCVIVLGDLFGFYWIRCSRLKSIDYSDISILISLLTGCGCHLFAAFYWSFCSQRAACSWNLIGILLAFIAFMLMPAQ